MDALKSAGRAIIKSPGVPRHTWGTSKHEKLPENWTDTKETLLEGMVFQVKYLGMTLVGQPKGEDMAAAAIHRIVSTARASAKKFRKVTLTISPKGIILTDTETLDLIENVSIYSCHGLEPGDVVGQGAFTVQCSSQRGENIPRDWTQQTYIFQKIRTFAMEKVHGNMLPG
uniref:Si:dkey-71h2.2 n=1 Tax=Oncorhynchus kisutch TaxID=8019 RepID=A0A8C7K724_ONCKI